MSGLLVFGALHYDVVVDAPALPRRDETLVGTAVDYRFGGKGGNQAVAAAGMGADVAMVGRVGADDAGRKLLAALDAAGVERSGVQEGGGATGMSVAITLPDGDYGAVIVSGANATNDGLLNDGVAPSVALIQNEVPGSANVAFARALPKCCKLIWNAAPARELSSDVAQRTDLLVVNRVEAADLTGEEDPEQSARILEAEVRGCAFVTLGAEGLVIATEGVSTWHKAYTVAAISTHGAGDMFVGALAARLSKGETVEAAFHFAQVAAALFVASEVQARHQVTVERVLAAL